MCGVPRGGDDLLLVGADLDGPAVQGREVERGEDARPAPPPTRRSFLAMRGRARFQLQKTTESPTRAVEPEDEHRPAVAASPVQEERADAERGRGGEEPPGERRPRIPSPAQRRPVHPVEHDPHSFLSAAAARRRHRAHPDTALSPGTSNATSVPSGITLRTRPFGKRSARPAPARCSS